MFVNHSLPGVSFFQGLRVRQLLAIVSAVVLPARAVNFSASAREIRRKNSALLI
jgi:hypothetical protein